MVVASAKATNCPSLDNRLQCLGSAQAQPSLGGTVGGVPYTGCIMAVWGSLPHLGKNVLCYQAYYLHSQRWVLQHVVWVEALWLS